MTPDELDAFLAEQDVVYLASLRKDGAPFVVPIGFDWDGESFFVTIALDHAGLHRLRRDPRVSLSIGSHPAFPTKFVVVEGVAEEVADPGARDQPAHPVPQDPGDVRPHAGRSRALLRELDLGGPGRVPRPGHVAARASTARRRRARSTRPARDCRPIRPASYPDATNIPREASSLITRSPCSRSRRMHASAAASGSLRLIAATMRLVPALLDRPAAVDQLEEVAGHDGRHVAHHRSEARRARQREQRAEEPVVGVVHGGGGVGRRELLLRVLQADEVVVAGAFGRAPRRQPVDEPEQLVVVAQRVFVEPVDERARGAA